VPTLILHAADDNLVPMEAALGHHRIIPQSELQLLEEGHMFIITRPDIAVPPIMDFIEAGTAFYKAQADRQRILATAEPIVYEMRSVEGISFAVLWLLLVVATFVSEDLTCISSGLLVVKGVMGFPPATLACGVGIFIGDVLLYLAGRWLGTDFIKRAPLRWLISESEIIRSSRWFEKRGAILIFITRFFSRNKAVNLFCLRSSWSPVP
jgi:hypothetical protein